MALTVTQAADFVRLTLSGKADAALSTLTLVNMTGSHLSSMAKWRFLERKASYLSTTASQTYVALPADFGGMVSLAAVGTNTYYRPADINDINRMRSSGIPSNGPPYLYAIIGTTPSGSTAQVQHLELFPTPTATTANAMSIVYRAKWVDLTADTDYICPAPFPDYCKVLFIRILQAFARGLQEEEQGSLSLRLNEMRGSPEFIAAAKQDRSMQPDMGEMQGSIPSWGETTSRLYFDTITGP
jgi:hypothetical protein